MQEKELEKQLKALANRRRLAILKYLKRVRQAPVFMIAQSIGLSLKATSKHLAILASLDIVDREQKGLQMWYRLNASHPVAIRHILGLL